MLMQLLAALAWAALAALAGLLAYGVNAINRWKHRHLPGPRPAPFLGNLGQAGPQDELHNALNRWAAQYGPIYVFFFGRQPNVVLSDPDLIRAAGVKHFASFHDRVIFLRVGSETEVEFEEKGMVLARGKYWAGLRGACEPLFHQSALESYTPVLHRALGGLAAVLDDACASEAAVNAGEVLAGMSMQAIGATVFGVDFDAQRPGGGARAEIVERAVSIFRPFRGGGLVVVSLSLMIPHLERLLTWLGVRLGAEGLVVASSARAFLWGAAQQLLDNSRKAQTAAARNSTPGEAAAAAPQGAAAEPAMGTESAPPQETGGAEAGSGDSGGRGDLRRVLSGFRPRDRAAFERARGIYHNAVPPSSSLVHRLQRAVSKESGQPLSDLEIASQCYTFLLAGYETTSLSLSYALYELAQHPHMQQRIWEEVATVLGPGGSDASALRLSDVERLQFTEAVFSETLRKYPPVASTIVLARTCTRNAVLGGYSIPAGSRVMFNILGLHRDPKHYPQPEAFRPERFLPDSDECQRRHPYAYIPFGLGPHKCIGYRFALQEAVLALARLCQRFEFSLDRERHPEGKELRLVSAATLQPKGGIWLRVRHA